MALRRRLTQPLGNAEEIEGVQAAIRFLCEREIDFVLDPRLIDRVVRYLDSSYDVLASRTRLRAAAESRWIQLRHGHFLKHARDGVEAVQALLARTRSTVAAVAALQPPVVLTDLLESARSVCEALAVTTGGRAPRSILVADRVFRIEGKEHLLRLLGILGELDALQGLAEATRRFQLVFPEILDTAEFRLEAEGVRHLFLDDPVANPARVSGGETLVFLTGPNMAGKTAYLKSVGVAVHLAHCGMAVPAHRFRVSVVDALYTSLRPEDNLRAGLSYFLAEVRRVHDVARHLTAGGRAFVMFDEIFRGTNVLDALEASKAVILGFSHVRSSGFIVSSHLVELADDLAGQEGVRFVHFHGEIRDGAARYGYALREGVSRERLGLQLLDQEGVTDLLAALCH